MMHHKAIRMHIFIQTSLAVDDVGTIRAEAEYRKFVLEVCSITHIC